MSLVRARFAFLPLVALLSACSSKDDSTEAPPAAAAFATSGSRLRARVLDGGDGARILSGLHDSELDFDCEPGITSDGAERCVPIASASQALVFADEGCQKPALLVAGCQDVPAYVALRSSSPPPGDEASCPSAPVTFVYAVGAGLPAYYENQSGFCGPASSMTTSPGAPKPTAYALGALLPSSKLVKVASTIREDRGAALTVDVDVFEDGARVATHRLHDTLRSGATCQIRSATTGRRCIPLAAQTTSSQGGLFVDASCTLPAVDLPPSSCGAELPGVLEVSSYSADSCPTVAFYELAGPTDSLFLAEDGGCVPYPAGPGAYMAASAGAGAPLAEDSFPSITSRRVGSGGVQARLSVTSDGAVVAEEGFVLAASGEACTPTRLPDGSTVCVAGQYLGANGAYFSDPACTSPVMIVPRPISAGKCDTAVDSPVTPTYGLEPLHAGCGEARVRARPLSAKPVAFSTLFEKSGSGVCSETLISADVDYYPAGDPVDLGAVFPRLGLGVE